MNASVWISLLRKEQRGKPMKCEILFAQSFSFWLENSFIIFVVCVISVWSMFYGNLTGIHANMYNGSGFHAWKHSLFILMLMFFIHSFASHSISSPSDFPLAQLFVLCANRQWISNEWWCEQWTTNISILHIFLHIKNHMQFLFKLERC